MTTPKIVHDLSIWIDNLDDFALLCAIAATFTVVLLALVIFSNDPPTE